MRRRRLCLAALLAALVLSGCGGAREAEQLRVLQSIGIDSAPAGLLLSLGAAAGPDGAEAARCYSGVGRSLPEALRDAESRSREEQLFCGHLRYLLIGEPLARQGLDRVMSAVCRSADLRLDMPMLIVASDEAGALIESCTGEEAGVCELLDAVRARQELMCGVPLITAGDFLRSWERSGCAAAWAVERTEPSEQDGGEPSLRIRGLALFSEGKLRCILDEREALGACLLTDSLRAAELTLQDSRGQPVSLEVHGGGLRLSPRRDEEGRLTGLDLAVEVSASVLDAPASAALTESGYADDLTARLENAVSERIRAALDRARALGLVYPDLQEKLELTRPLRLRRDEEPLRDLLPELELSLTVRGELQHSGEERGAAA